MSVTIKAGQTVQHIHMGGLYIIELITPKQVVIKGSAGNLYVVALSSFEDKYRDVRNFFIENQQYRFKNGNDIYVVTQVIENTNPMYSFQKLQAVARYVDSVSGKGYLTILSQDDFSEMQLAW